MRRHVLPARLPIFRIKEVLQFLGAVDDLTPFAQNLEVDPGQHARRCRANFAVPDRALGPRQSWRCDAQLSGGDRLSFGIMTAIRSQCAGEGVEFVAFAARGHAPSFSQIRRFGNSAMRRCRNVTWARSRK